MTTQKLLGLLIIAIGVPFGITALDGKFSPTVFVCAGLILIFFGAERVNDERVQQLKMRAIYAAMIAGLALALIAFVALHRVSPKLGFQPRELSAFEFLAAILLLSLGLFHFFRWQDAQPRVEVGHAVPPGGLHRAPWATSLKLTSLLVSLILAGTAIAFGRRGGWEGWIPAAGAIALLVGMALFTVRGYAIVDSVLVVRRPFWCTRLPLEGLVEARAEPDAMQSSLRTFGNGGGFSYTGRFQSERLGSYRAFVTDPARTVVLRWPDRTVVISPASPEAFVHGLSVKG